MKTVLAILVLLVVAQAQTVYVQSAIQKCEIQKWVCDSIPLHDGNTYQFECKYGTLLAGSPFSLTTEGTTHSGEVIEIVTQPLLTVKQECQKEKVCSSGQLKFKFKTTDNIVGMVNANVSIEKVCGRYCFPLPWLEGSTITIQ